MINPLLTRGEFLFIVDGCSHCSLWKNFIYKMNSEFKPGRRIAIIDCTLFQKYGIYTDPIIKIFEGYIDGYPILFIKGARKDGANSVIECEQWLRIKKFNDFYFPQEIKVFETINKSEIFEPNCKIKNKRLFCEYGE